MKSKVKVSVVIPTYNRDTILNLTLKSLINQDYDLSKYEVIVVDDGSNDNTEEVVKKYNDKLQIKYIYQSDEGYRVSLARNKGIRISDGEIIVLLDSGMIVPSYFIRNHIQEHTKSQDSLAVIGYVFANSENDSNNFEKNITFYDQINILIKNIEKQNMYMDLREKVYKNINDNINNLSAPWCLFWTSNVSIKREVLFSIGFFDEDFIDWGVEDIELGYRLFKYGCKFILSRDACALHYPHERNIIGNKKTNQNNKFLFLKKHPAFEVELFCHNWALELNSQIDSFVNYSIKNSGKREIHKYLNNSTRKFLLKKYKKQKCIIVGFQDNSFLQLFDDPVILEMDREIIKNNSYKKIYNLIGCRTPFDEHNFEYLIITDIINYLNEDMLCLLFEEAFRISKNIDVLNYRKMFLPKQYDITNKKKLNDRFIYYSIERNK